MKTAPTRQRGQSLISMLIGLAISLITIAAMLVLYKTLINVSTNASRAAVRDGQVSAALLGAQMDLQSAGFGVAATDALSTRLAISTDGKQVVWRNKANITDATYQCSGLLLVDGSGLYALPAKACTDASAVTWASTERQLVTGASAFFVPSVTTTSASGTTTTASTDEAGATSLTGNYRFTLGTAHACLPYMQQDFATTPGAQAQQITLASSTTTLFSICMPNLTS